MLLAFTEQGSGPVVVLLHGFPLSRVMWAQQLKTLSESYRVIAPDLRGHGESPAPDTAYTMDLMADDVVELLDGLGVVEPVVVGGLSMGGYVALAMALKHPGRVRALMLIDTKAAADSPEAAKTREETAQAVLKAGNSGAVVAAMIPKLFGKTTREQYPDRIGPLKADMEKTSASGVAGALRGMAIRPDRREQLADVAVPTLVIVGEEDVIAPPDEARAMAEALPNGRLEIVPDAGHLAPYENPEAVDRVILGFLQGLN
jgi:pimeloyl-ACP methyl ester carboxylesterase